MKFCDISSFYSDLGGGVKTYHSEKLRYFGSSTEHDYVFVKAGKRYSSEIVDGARVYTVRGFPVSRSGVYRQIFDLQHLREIIRLEEPDVLEAGSPYLDGWLTLFGSRKLDPLTVGFYHADVPDSYIAPAVKNLPRSVGEGLLKASINCVRFAYRHFDATVVTSHYIQDKLRGWALDNTHIVPLGVDADFFHPDKRDDALRQELGAGPADRILFYAGRFCSEKGIENLLRGIKRLDKQEGITIVLVGNGPLETEVQQCVASCRSVKNLGYVSDREHLAALYASSDLFLAPSPHETFGLSVLEAMASGLPVVGAGSAGTGELVRKSGTGRCFYPGSTDHLVMCVEDLLCRDLRAEGERARRFAVKNFNWTRTFDRMVRLYQRLYHEKRSRNRLAA